MWLILASSSLNDYLAPSGIVDFDNDAVKRTALRLSAHTRGQTDAAKAFFDFVSHDIRHTFDIGASEVACRASDVLKYGHGLCYAKSNLLAALLRSSGIPAGFCYQRIEDGSPSGFVVHGLNAAYFKETGQWIRMDARGKPGVEVPFDIRHDMLAFTVDESLGESEDPTIYPAPAESIIKLLMQCGSARELMDKLPDRI